MVMEWVLPFLLLLGFLIVTVPVGVYFGAVALLWERPPVGCPLVLGRKACLGLAETHSVSTALLPRYSLIAGGRVEK
jgi:hypothetical protein